MERVMNNFVYGAQTMASTVDATVSRIQQLEARIAAIEAKFYDYVAMSPKRSRRVKLSPVSSAAAIRNPLFTEAPVYVNPS